MEKKGGKGGPWRAYTRTHAHTQLLEVSISPSQQIILNANKICPKATVNSHLIRFSDCWLSLLLCSSHILNWFVIKPCIHAEYCVKSSTKHTKSENISLLTFLSLTIKKTTFSFSPSHSFEEVKCCTILSTTDNKSVWFILLVFQRGLFYEHKMQLKVP